MSLSELTSKTIAPISVVIPCFRCSDTIRRAVESIANQTVVPKEVIVVDDASDDNEKTLKILHMLPTHYATIPSIRIIELPKNIGASGARNIGWEKATQLYIAFLDADDAWHEKKIEIQYSFMKKFKNVSLSAHDYIIKSDHHIVRNEKKKNISKNFKIKPFNILIRNQFATPTVMLLKSLPYRFSSRKRFSEDYLLWLKIVLSGYEVRKIKMPLTFLYKDVYGHRGLSGNLWDMEKGEIDTYKQLMDEKYISLFVYICLIFLSVSKFTLRILIVICRALLR